MVFPTGYDSQVIGTPAWKAVQGGYFETEFRPFSLPNVGTYADEGGAGQVRQLLGQRVSVLQPVRVLAGAPT